MKKTLQLALTIIFVLSMSITPCFAEINVKSAQDTLLDSQINFMFEQAKENHAVPVSKGQLVSEHGDVYSVDVYELDTTNLTRNLNLADDDVSSHTFVADLSSATLLSRSSGSSSDDYWDKSQSVRAYSTIYYNSDDSGVPKILLTKVSGGYTIHESGISVTNQSVHYVCTDSVQNTKSQNITKYPSGSNYSYNTGFTKYIVKNTGIMQQCGSKHTMTISRNSRTWSFSLENHTIH